MVGPATVYTLDPTVLCVEYACGGSVVAPIDCSQICRVEPTLRNDLVLPPFLLAIWDHGVKNVP